MVEEQNQSEQSKLLGFLPVGKRDISENVMGLACIVTFFALLTIIIYQQGQLMQGLRTAAIASVKCVQ